MGYETLNYLVQTNDYVVDHYFKEIPLDGMRISKDLLFPKGVVTISVKERPLIFTAKNAFVSYAENNQFYVTFKGLQINGSLESEDYRSAVSFNGTIKEVKIRIGEQGKRNLSEGTKLHILAVHLDKKDLFI